MAGPLYRKLLRRRIWERLLRERLSEPLHLNPMAVLVALVGSFDAKVSCDLVLRQHNAFCLLQAAKFAQRCGKRAFTAIEFGVANGAGLLNMARLAKRVSTATGIRIEFVGFDRGSGMPGPADYRDHPDFYAAGDFPMQDYDGLRRLLPANTRLILGDIAETMPAFLKESRESCPLGYAVLDVDFYSSTVACLKVFEGAPELYLPETLLYLDDVLWAQHNPWQGELLAIDEFSGQHERRKICPYNQLAKTRLFQRAQWLSQVYLLHVLDHPWKQRAEQRAPATLANPYIGLRGSL